MLCKVAIAEEETARELAVRYHYSHTCFKQWCVRHGATQSTWMLKLWLFSAFREHPALNFLLWSEMFVLSVWCPHCRHQSVTSQTVISL